MEFTYQSTMQLPASYAVLSEDEMVYTVGGAFELNINAQDVLNFTVNVGVNLVRMLGQAAISNTIAGIIDMRNDGLTTMGAIEHYWGRQTPVGKTMTVVAAGFAGVYVYYWARSAIESFLSIYNDMRNIYNESEAKKSGTGRRYSSSGRLSKSLKGAFYGKLAYACILCNASGRRAAGDLWRRRTGRCIGQLYGQPSPG